MNGYRWFNNAYDRNVIHRPASNDESFSKNLIQNIVKLGARAQPYVKEAVVGTAKLTGAAVKNTAKIAAKNPFGTGAALYVASKYTDKSNPQEVFNPFAAPYAGVDPGVPKPTAGLLGRNRGETVYNSDNVTLPELGRDPETVVKSQQVSPAQTLHLIVRSLLHTI